jgi:hypothetical protein
MDQGIAEFLRRPVLNPGLQELDIWRLAWCCFFFNQGFTPSLPEMPVLLPAWVLDVPIQHSCWLVGCLIQQLFALAEAGKVAADFRVRGWSQT